MREAGYYWVRVEDKDPEINGWHVACWFVWPEHTDAMHVHHEEMTYWGFAGTDCGDYNIVEVGERLVHA